MKVLHVNTNDISGGAARAVYRLHHALLQGGIDSQMLVQNKATDEISIFRTAKNNYDKFFSIFRPTIDSFALRNYPNRDKTLFSPALASFSNLIKRIDEINPDIVHLHWICGGYFPLKDLLKINRPLVWSLHDNWAFTGGCHIKWDCEEYKRSCGKCPRLGSTKENDLSRKVFLHKMKIYSELIDLKIIGLSQWITECTQQSSLLKKHKVLNLPNVIDCELYKPIDKNLARQILQLPLDKKLIIFGAVNATSDINKGFNQLIQALRLIGPDVDFVVFGSSNSNQTSSFSQKTYFLGHLYDDYSLALIYSAADVMVVPSLQENLSNAIMEALSCRTPVVAFDVGGNQDLILHKKNGYLAKPYDVLDLANGILWILNHEKLLEIGDMARQHILNNFSRGVVIPLYTKLYEDMLKNYEE